MAKLNNTEFAKVVHDLCVAAGVKCNHRACSVPRMKRTPASTPWRRNLSVRDALAMCARPAAPEPHAV